MGIIECIPTSEGPQARLVSQIVIIVLHLEKQVNMEPASPFRAPLMQVLLRFAKVATDVFLSDDFMKVGFGTYCKFCLFLILLFSLCNFLQL